MSRSELLIQLAEAGVQNDSAMLERTLSALVAEARAKQHHTLANRLAQVLGQEDGRRKPRAVGGTLLPDKVRDLIIEKPARRALDDLVLPALVSEQVHDLIEEQQAADVLRSHSLDPRHKVMLAGPPGNGKTTLAEGLAYALSVPFYVVRYEAVVGSYLGETAARLKKVFDFARATPCVLFLDEFDAIGKERGDAHETGEIKRVVSSLLMQIDDLPSYTVVVCATNHPELLDRAVWRRFQLRLEMPSPTQDDFKRWLGHVGVTEQSISIDPSLLAKELVGSSYAEAEELLLDIKRKLVLSGSRIPSRNLVMHRIHAWRQRFNPEGRELAEDNGREGRNSPD